MKIKCLFFLLLLPLLMAMPLQAEIKSSWDVSSQVLYLEIETPIGLCLVYRPDTEEMQRTADLAKRIFQDAFSATYQEYHRQSGSMQTIEEWLRLKEGLSLETWLSHTFDEEYAECLQGLKRMIYLSDVEGNLIGWLSHSPLSEKGDIYLSQCSLEACFHNQRVATTLFAAVVKNDYINEIFPGAKELKLITRKINWAAHCLYIRAGFRLDETLDPGVYGDSYDDRYVGYRLFLEMY